MKRVFPRLCIKVTVLALCALPAAAATYVVDPDGDGDFSSIQAATDAAAEGDTVLVRPGIYTVSPEAGWPPAAIVNPGSKNLVIQSTDGPSVTILDGDYAAVAGVWVEGGQTVAETTIDGFTIRRCQMGGVHLRSSSATLRSLIVEECVYDCCGGGVAAFTDLAGPDFVDCVIRGNQSPHAGGVSVYSGLGARFERCVITGNYAWDVDPKGGPRGHAGGVSVSGASTEFVECTIAGNLAVAAGGGIGGTGQVGLVRTICRDNCPDDVAVHALMQLTIACSAFEPSGIAGTGLYTDLGHNITADPQFCDPAPCIATGSTDGNYGLRPGSPCGPRNSPCSLPIGALGQACVPVDAPASVHGATRMSIAAVPNPTRDSITLDLTVATAQDVDIRVFDVAGRQVSVHFIEVTGGTHRIALDVPDLPRSERPGTALYWVEAAGAEDTVVTKVLVLP